MGEGRFFLLIIFSSCKVVLLTYLAHARVKVLLTTCFDIRKAFGHINSGSSKADPDGHWTYRSARALLQNHTLINNSLLLLHKFRRANPNRQKNLQFFFFYPEDTYFKEFLLSALMSVCPYVCQFVGMLK